MQGIFGKNIGKKKRGYMLMGCVCLFFLSMTQTGFASDLLAHFRQQNSITSERMIQLPGYVGVANYHSDPRPYCADTQDIDISIFMYHYIRPSHRDPEGSVVRHNSVTPGMFDKHMQYVHTLQKNNDIHIGFLSDLEHRETTNCFPHKRIFIFTSDDGRRDNYKYLYPTAVKYGVKFNLGIIFEKTKHEFEREGPFSSINEVKEIARHPLMEIQSHSMTHADLRHISYEEQVTEICNSKNSLEELLTIDINTFIVPFGGMSPYVSSIAQSCGYTYALSTKSGTVSPQELSTRRFDLERVRVHRNTTPEQLFGN